MDLASKLVLTARNNVITLFDEGLFIKAYNQSAYILTDLLGLKLKLLLRISAKSEEGVLVYVGLPRDTVLKYLPTAEKRFFGYEVLGHYDLSGYCQWLLQKKTLIIMDDKAQLSPNQPSQNLTLSINHKQLAFLQSWQANHYSNKINEAFIASLKKRLIELD